MTPYFALLTCQLHTLFYFHHWCVSKLQIRAERKRIHKITNRVNYTKRNNKIQQIIGVCLSQQDWNNMQHIRGHWIKLPRNHSYIYFTRNLFRLCAVSHLYLILIAITNNCSLMKLQDGAETSRDLRYKLWMHGTVIKRTRSQFT